MRIIFQFILLLATLAAPFTLGAHNDGTKLIEFQNKLNKKTEICENLVMFGNCPYAHHCKYAHSLDELRKKLRNKNFRTSLCRSYMKSGSCPFGYRCNYAHGEHKLREQAPQSYKEYCPYSYREFMLIEEGSEYLSFLAYLDIYLKPFLNQEK